jgi:hypothetical protein
MSNNNFKFAEPRMPLPLPSIKNLKEMKNYISKEYFDGTKQREYDEKLAKYKIDIVAWKAAEAVREAARLKKRAEEEELRRRKLPESGRRMLPESGRRMPSEPLHYPHAAIAASSAAPPVAPTPGLPTPVNPADPVAYDAYLLELEKRRDSLLEERNRLQREAAGRREKNAAGVHVLPGGRRKTCRRSKKAKRRSSRRNRSA